MREGKIDSSLGPAGPALEVEWQLHLALLE